MRLIYHPEAEAELVEAAHFYEHRVPGLGEEFVKYYELAIAKVLENPDRWRICEGDIRRFIMNRFPYSILYRLENESVRVLAVKHHSRHPDYWKKRLIVDPNN
jgi:toxin ParE1/3/4